MSTITTSIHMSTNMNTSIIMTMNMNMRTSIIMTMNITTPVCTRSST